MKTVVVYSGGLDSTVLLYALHAEGKAACALAFDYGQRHKKELSFARKCAAELGVPFSVADVSAIAPLIAGQSSQLNLSVEVPEGHYAADNMKATIVPNRNMIMLSIAIGHALATGCDAVAYGAHAGDHTIYPDCREPFARAMAEAALQCDFRPITLMRPFVALTKADIVRRGAALGVPFADTWSCYKGESVHCGRCGTCVERREAFAHAGVTDPTAYRAS